MTGAKRDHRRTAEIERDTAETRIHCRLDLDPDLDAGPVGPRHLEVPNGFFRHMLDALATHAGLGLEISARGDTEVDLHHTVEDVGIVLGEALRKALGERRGVVRFGHAYAPLDEALARAVIDLSGRGFFVWEAPPEIASMWVGRDFPVSLTADFFQAFADRGRLTLHLSLLAARNGHHAVEAGFKAVAVALRHAIRVQLSDPEAAAVPSTKGTLSR